MSIPEGYRFAEVVIQDKRAQHTFFQEYDDKYKRIRIFPELGDLAVKNKALDTKFEFLRNIQQNPDLDREPYGTNFIDFTKDPKIALFFGNNERSENEEGVLYVVIQKNIGKSWLKTSLDEAMQEFRKTVLSNQEYSYLPILINPKNQINNALDQKPILQRAIYFCQMDFRYDLELAWQALHYHTNKQVYFKIILPKYSNKEISEFLDGEGITKKFVFYQDQSL